MQPSRFIRTLSSNNNDQFRCLSNDEQEAFTYVGCVDRYNTRRVKLLGIQKLDLTPFDVDIKAMKCTMVWFVSMLFSYIGTVRFC